MCLTGLGLRVAGVACGFSSEPRGPADGEGQAAAAGEAVRPGAVLTVRVSLCGLCLQLPSSVRCVLHRLPVVSPSCAPAALGRFLPTLQEERDCARFVRYYGCNRNCLQSLSVPRAHVSCCLSASTFPPWLFL